MGADLRAADEYWRTRVAEPYGPRTLLSKLTDNKSTAESLEKALYDPRGFEQIQQLKREMDLVDPGAWDLVKRRWGQKLMDAAVDKTTGAWSEKKFVEAVLKHSPESIDAILGSSAAPFTNMVRRYQKSMADPTAPGSPLQAAHLFREFVGSNGEVIVAGLGKRTPQELATMRQLVGDQKWERITRSWWEDVVLKGAKDPNQQVTRARFLTQLRKVSDDQLTELLGPKGATEFKEFRDLLQYQEKLASVRVKESGTGQTMVPLYQAGAAASAIGALAHGLVVGNKTEIIGGATGIGLSVTPAVLAYALSNPQGIRLLSAVVRQFPDAKTAITRFGIWAGQKGLQTHPPKTDVSPFFQPAEVPSAKLQ
ncbi:MAG TPA: hypothetical protein VJ301_14475 [Propionibacteriaceae bacterium]|nr:hypothetical protein [Propionibacteriaceae bacterium]